MRIHLSSKPIFSSFKLTWTLLQTALSPEPPRTWWCLCKVQEDTAQEETLLMQPRPVYPSGRSSGRPFPRPPQPRPGRTQRPGGSITPHGVLRPWKPWALHFAPSVAVVVSFLWPLQSRGLQCLFLGPGQLAERRGHMAASSQKFASRRKRTTGPGPGVGGRKESLPQGPQRPGCPAPLPDRDSLGGRRAAVDTAEGRGSLRGFLAARRAPPPASTCPAPRSPLCVGSGRA